MPTYSYFCDKCQTKFEIFCSIKDYVENASCSNCKNNKNSHRLYIEDISTLSTSIKKNDSELKTIGDLANRNRDRLSEDHKAELDGKHNNYKEEVSKKELPKGMSRIQKPKIKHRWNG
jgi:putative FmdB family regulatory protein